MIVPEPYYRYKMGRPSVSVKLALFVSVIDSKDDQVNICEEDGGNNEYRCWAA